jgi:hypothetical protein
MSTLPAEAATEYEAGYWNGHAIVIREGRRCAWTGGRWIDIDEEERNMPEHLRGGTSERAVFESIAEENAALRAMRGERTPTALTRAELENHETINNTLRWAVGHRAPKKVIDALSLGGDPDTVEPFPLGFRGGAGLGANCILYGAPVLGQAAASGSIEIVKILLDAGADINKKDSLSLCAPIIGAIFMKRAKTVELLIKRGADLETVQKEGFTPARMAMANGGNPEILRLILEGGADSRAVCYTSIAPSNLWSEFHKATRMPNSRAINRRLAECCAILLEFGANPLGDACWCPELVQPWRPAQVAPRAIVTTLMRGGCDMSLIGPNLNEQNCEDKFCRMHGTQLSAELGRSILGAEIELRLYAFQCPDTVRLCSLFLYPGLRNITTSTHFSNTTGLALLRASAHTAGNPR